jgi:hypothetical protein
MICHRCGQETYTARSHHSAQDCLVAALNALHHMREALAEHRRAIDDAFGRTTWSWSFRDCSACSCKSPNPARRERGSLPAGVLTR